MILAAAGVRATRDRGRGDGMAGAGHDAPRAGPGRSRSAMSCRRRAHPGPAGGDRRSRSPRGTTAERVFLRALGAGCTAPVGAHAVSDRPEPGATASQGRVRLQALVASPDGRQAGSGRRRRERRGGGRAPGAGGARGGCGRHPGGDPGSAAAGRPAHRRHPSARPDRPAGGGARATRRHGARDSAGRDRADRGHATARRSACAPRELPLGRVHERERRGRSPRAARGKSLPATSRVAAVGPATAEAIRTLGVEAAFVPDRFAAEEIAAGLGPLQGARILFRRQTSPRRASRSSFAPGERWWTPSRPTARSRSSRLRETLSELERGVDAIVVASGSAARSLAALPVGTLSTDAVIVCIGPKTAQAAREVGLPVGLGRRRGDLRGHH